MQSIRTKSLDILTKGQKLQAKQAEKAKLIEEQKAQKDQIHKKAQNWVNNEVAENLFKDRVQDFAKKGFQTYNYYLDLTDFEEDLPGGVIKLPEDFEVPQKWNKDTKQLEPIVYTLQSALRSKFLREFVQDILDTEFPGMSVRVFADNFKNEDGDPNKFTIKLHNKNGQAKQKRRQSKNATIADFIPPEK